MMCVADINSATFVKVNPAFTEISGFSEEEFQSKSFYRFIYPDDIESTKQVVSKKLKKDEKVISKELVPGAYLQLAVKDIGHGIPPDVKDWIFDPYFTTKEIGKESGMGLAIVHGIVINHDGAIRINSQNDRGTTVEVLLPVCREALIKDNETHKMQLGGSERILLVDDEKSIAVMMKTIFEVIGISC